MAPGLSLAGVQLEIPVLALAIPVLRAVFLKEQMQRLEVLRVQMLATPDQQISLTDPQETLGSGRQASGSRLSARRRYGNLRQSQRGPKPLAANGATQIHRVGDFSAGNDSKKGYRL
jgi:hypothetical protein